MYIQMHICTNMGLLMVMPVISGYVFFDPRQRPLRAPLHRTMAPLSAADDGDSSATRRVAQQESFQTAVKGSFKGQRPNRARPIRAQGGP